MAPGGGGLKGPRSDPHAPAVDHASAVDAGALALLRELVAAVGRPGAAGLFYARASERMRASFGREENFVRAFTNDRFAPLANGTAAELGGAEQVGESARATLTVTTRDGRAVFVLAVARPAASGEWRLSGVAREGADL